MGLAIMAAAFCVPGEAPAAPAVVVDRFVEAHNARDMDGIKRVVAADAQIGIYPGSSMRPGLEVVPSYERNTFPAMPGLETTVLQRVMDADVVVQFERLTWGGGRSAEGMTIYRVQGGCITRLEVVSAEGQS